MFIDIIYISESSISLILQWLQLELLQQQMENLKRTVIFYLFIFLNK